MGFHTGNETYPQSKGCQGEFHFFIPQMPVQEPQQTHFSSKTVRIIPEKGSNPRVFKISEKLISMLNRLRKSAEKIWGYNDSFNLSRSFRKQRKRIANKLGNPRLLQIHFHTIRHWKATTEYIKTKDILHVQSF